MSSRASAVLLVLTLAAPSVALALPDLLETPTTGVTIRRDAYGVPHVYADTAYGIFWGNGYVQAQDRLFQLDVLRHVGKGESALYLGPSQLEMDLATRRELYTDAEREERWNGLPAADRAMFQGFADGVNAWIAKTRADPLLLSGEFYALGHLPEEWVATDTIAIAEFLLDIFGAGSGGNELDNAKLLLRLQDVLGDDETAWSAFHDLFWMHDASTYTTVPAGEGAYAPTEAPLPTAASLPPSQRALLEAAAGARPFAGAMTLQDAAQRAGFPTKFGSNALVVSPSLAESGNALLLGGPQMAYYNPMIPYEVGLHGAGFDAVGMGVGGAPGVIIGRTPHYAWTVTSGSSDQVDVVAVKLAPGDARSYYRSGTSGQIDAMDCRIETHVGPPTAIDQNPPVLAVQEVCRTSRGPVFAINEEAGYAFVRERTHRLDELRSGILWLTLSQAQDLAAFQAHMDTFRFEFNFHVATDAGEIAYFHWGANPVRDPACDPRLPRLAGACDWTAVRTGDDLPWIKDPAKGYLVNWNNKPAQGWSGGDSMEKWGPVHRAELFESVVQRHLAVDGKLSAADLKAINVEISTRSPFPPNLVPALLDATSTATNPQIVAARDALASWAATGYGWDDANADGKYDAPGFAIYETWRGLLQETVFRDELGPHVRVMGFVPEFSSDPHAADHGREDNKDNTLVNALHGDTSHAWCDDVTTSATESCGAAFRSAFLGALAELSTRFNTTDVSAWKQPIHTMKFVALSGGPAHRIPMVNRPSFNHYYDFGTGEAGSVLPPGTDQYWKALDLARFMADGTYPDPHKTDQLALYVAFQYKPAQMQPLGGPPAQTFVVRCPAC